MTRREALTAIAAMFAAAATDSRLLLAADSPAAEIIRSGKLPAELVAILNEFGETILPKTTSSGGAKEAQVGEFMAELFRDYLGANERAEMLETVEKIDAASATRFSRTFMDLHPTERHELLLSLEADQDADYYRRLKSSINWGYFTSEIGATQALQHVPIPGRFEGCITVEPDYRAWSS